jgi:uncharacterized protein (UPF0332 family)
LAISPQHLLDQASMLTRAQTGRPRGTDLRRAVSAAYYAVFHAIASAAADSVVPANKRATEEYARVYRSINHGALRKLCERVRAKNFDFENDIREFAAAVADLQEKRHSADYDPLFKTTISDTILTIAAARTAISQFEDGPAEGRAYFLSLLLFPPRRAE